MFVRFPHTILGAQMLFQDAEAILKLKKSNSTFLDESSEKFSENVKSQLKDLAEQLLEIPSDVLESQAAETAFLYYSANSKINLPKELVEGLRKFNLVNQGDRKTIISASGASAVKVGYLGLPDSVRNKIESMGPNRPRVNVKRTILFQVAKKANEVELTPHYLSQIMDYLNIEYFLMADAVEFLGELWKTKGSSRFWYRFMFVILSRVADFWYLYASCFDWTKNLPDVVQGLGGVLGLSLGLDPLRGQLPSLIPLLMHHNCSNLKLTSLKDFLSQSLRQHAGMENLRKWGRKQPQGDTVDVKVLAQVLFG